MKSFEALLASSAAAHGHLCPGQVVGVRMAMLGCRLIGLDEPTRRDQVKKLIVYVEMDRCTADAIARVTGVKFWKTIKSMKIRPRLSLLGRLPGKGSSGKMKPVKGK